MFGTKHNECVGFESRWRVKKVSTECSTQTTEYAASEKGTNTLEKTSIEVQTVVDEKVERNVEVDMQKLADWLSKIYPKVKKEIDEANNSQAFRGYQLADELCEANCNILQTIGVSNVPEGSNKLLKVSVMSWNHTGKSIALTCSYEHKSWCYHPGMVSIYTLNNNERFMEPPKKKLQTETCVVTLKFHSSHPAILAAGTFSGNVILWNTQNDEDNVLCIVSAHAEPLTQLSWINDADATKTVLLATSSTDGLLKTWNFNVANSVLKIKAKYKIKAPLFANSRRDKESSLVDRKKDSRGVVCFDFSKHVSDLFVVGTEGGLLVQCSTVGASELRGRSDAA